MADEPGDGTGSPQPSGEPRADAAPERPVFALNTVLFPGGALSLRVFEPRYVDMVRECLRNDQPFVVARITQGTEVGTAAEHEAVGTLARIVRWDMDQPGVLLIRAIGGERVQLLDRRVQSDGLIRARTQTLADSPEPPVPANRADCVELLRRLIATLEQQGASPDALPIDPPYRFDSSRWVGWRLCELLPLPLATRQRLLALDDPLQTLAVVHTFLR